jgi:hypothetical protein
MTQGGLFDTPAPRAHERDDKVLFRFTLLSGEVVVGPVHGSGGIIRGGDKIRPLALRRLLGAQEVAAEGRDTGLAEPAPGSVRVYIEYHADGGADRAVPLAGALIELASDAEEVDFDARSRAALLRARANEAR